MVQFYFLSIFFTTIGGLSLTIDSMHRKSEAYAGLRSFLRDSNVRLVVGILAVVTGALKLLTVIRGDIPIVGDFLPAFSGIVVGITLLLELYRGSERVNPFRNSTPMENHGIGNDSPTPSENKASIDADDQSRGIGKIEVLLLEHKAAVGMAGMIAGLVHFLFPAVLFL